MIHLELPGSAIYVGYMPVLLQLTPLLAPPLPPCQAFNLLNLIIDRMGDHIRPFVGEMLRLMPALWQRAEGSSLVRIQVRVRGAEGSSLVRIQVRVRGAEGSSLVRIQVSGSQGRYQCRDGYSKGPPPNSGSAPSTLPLPCALRGHGLGISLMPSLG